MKAFTGRAFLAAALLLATGGSSQPIPPRPDTPIANPYRTVGDLLDCLDDRVTLVSAHRGGPGPGAPENALLTAERTVAAGPVLLELDVRATRDGVLVLMHDDTLDRTTTGDGPLRSRTWAEIHRLSLKDPTGAVVPGASPPRLEQVLEWARGKAVVQLDLKERETLPAIVAAVRKAHARPYALLIVYSVEDAARAAALDPLLTINVAVDDLADLQELARKGVPAARITAWTGTSAPDARLWRELDRRGVPVGFGTLGRRDRAIAQTGEDRAYRELAEAGVDVLATDRPLPAFRATDRGGGTRRALQACRAAPTR